ncbi:MAG TPA: four helix bundle protein [Candidatus Binatia bacterium]|jgi:four helix bundle protein|nr:four helix bundle protein [Candidatus Binatia bacterium]
MNSSVERFQTFEDLDVYKAARQFRKKMYAVARWLPDYEKFKLASQIRGAAVSLTNNIAEGHGRFHYLDQIRFMLQARGSLQELVDDLNVCDDESYIPTVEVATSKNEGWSVLRLLNGYLRWLRARKLGQDLELREDSIPYGDTDDELEAWLASLPLEPVTL